MFKNKVLKYILITPVLLAFQCGDDLSDDKLEFNHYKVQIAPQKASFSLNDTIWINGKVSSKAYDVANNDSIFNEDPESNVFSIYKFFEPTEISNCKDAIDNFDIITDLGHFSNSQSCENASLEAFPELESNAAFYNYRIGLKPKSSGDFVISWQDGILQNMERNEYIVNNYPIENFPDQIGFSTCGEVSWKFINDTNNEYFFTIE